MANKPVKVKVLSLDPKTLGIKPQCDITEVNTETPAVAPAPKNDIPEPAITFGYNRVASVDGAIANNGHVYDTFMKINEECLNVSADALQADNVNYGYIASNIQTEAETTVNIIKSSYANAVANHWYNFVSLFNTFVDTVGSISKDKFDSNLDNRITNECYLNYRVPYECHRNCYSNTFWSVPYNERDNIISSGVLHADIVADANNRGVYMYNEAYEHFCKLLAIVPMSKDDVLDKLVNTFNATFAQLMANISYETSVYYQNIVNFNSMAPSYTEITNIRALAGDKEFTGPYYEN